MLYSDPRGWGITGGGIFGQELIIRPRLLRAKNKFLGHRGLSALLWTVDTFVFGFERSQGQFDGGRRSQSVLLFFAKEFSFLFQSIQTFQCVLRGCYVIKKEICMKKRERKGSCCCV